MAQGHISLSGARVAGGEAEGVEGRQRHRGPTGAAIQPRRGVPPAVPREGRAIHHLVISSIPVVQLRYDYTFESKYDIIFNLISRLEWDLFT
jgi:hypothetical protein